MPSTVEEYMGMTEAAETSGSSGDEGRFTLVFLYDARSWTNRDVLERVTAVVG